MTLQIDIHDVGHGACAVATCDDGYRMMFDCGRTALWRPSSHYPLGSIDALLLSNLDQDHLADLDGVLTHVQPGIIAANPTVDLNAFLHLKGRPDRMSSGLLSFARLLRRSTSGSWLHSVRYAGEPEQVDIYRCWNSVLAFPDNSNNLSLLTVVQYGEFKIVFAGDLETAGWRNLLVNPQIRAVLNGVNVLMASHHGRENGQSAEAMALMKPNIVVFSDSRGQHESQKTDAWYRSRVPGIRQESLFGAKQQRRRVFTTRRDGNLRIRADKAGRYDLSTDRGAFVLPFRWDPQRLGNSWDYDELIQALAQYQPSRTALPFD